MKTDQAVADERFMRRALAMARRGLGRTSPNPTVGAVIVKDGEVLAAGYHRAAGKPHAEIEALARAGKRAERATMYVTLEPCNHHGRTPPCTEAILESGLGCVVVGMRDPNPRVAGGGCEKLRRQGVEVREGVLEAECCRLNEAFVKFVTTGAPMVTAKTAMTLDGFTATVSGDSKWITGERSRHLVHRLRDRVDVVMVGVGTVLADNPRLTVRAVRRANPQPYRVIVDSNLRTPKEAAVVACGDPERTIIAVGKGAPRVRRREFSDAGVELVECPEGPDGIDIGALLGILAAREVVNVLVEGGARLLGSMLRERLIDKVYIFRAPLLLGGSDGVPMAFGPGADEIRRCLKLKDLRVRRIDNDVLTVGYPEYPDRRPGLPKKDAAAFAG
ncbi:MAG TPA: bifunctional diaminohydroxyphosphoribosylaminopyrimidine deaminase/5-amino-6-(5-phosphoribosylamino)uracil reductase RibD [Desulfobacteraceae bacterium]|nr:bifunctional diaminohydroxyphosphoribosylaminopyrimidine deaminase/5-amino-6-(5-phosphoribosylamino)uracil reductase RibD [Desulfobacteraceae bacterium]